MYWKRLKIIIPFMVLALLVATPCLADKGVNKPSDPGPPEEPTVVPKFIWMNGTVEIVELYELKETLYFYDQDGFLVEYLVPVDEPDALYFLTVEGDQEVDGDGDGVIDFELKDGDQWLLDFGPEWYAADPCLVDSYICAGDADGGLIKTGPFVLGDFTCSGDLVAGVVSNDPNTASDTIPLMSRTARNALPDAVSVYAFGRSGGSEIVWIYDSDGDGVFERYPKAGSNILWEADDGTGQAWWRGEAPPQAMTSELSCDYVE